MKFLTTNLGTIIFGIQMMRTKIERVLLFKLIALTRPFKRGVNRGTQIRRSVVFLGPIRRSDLIFVQIRIRVTLKILRGIWKVAL